DYYALAGILKSTKTMENFKVVARWQERSLGSNEELAEQEIRQRAIAASKAEIQRVTTEANNTLLQDARRRLSSYLLAVWELSQQGISQGKLKSLLAEDPAHSDIIILEAEEFLRGNLKREFTGYGEKIGVIYNQGELPNFAEYEVDLTGAEP